MKSYNYGIAFHVGLRVPLDDDSPRWDTLNAAVRKGLAEAGFDVLSVVGFDDDDEEGLAAAASGVTDSDVLAGSQTSE